MDWIPGMGWGCLMVLVDGFLLFFFNTCGAFRFLNFALVGHSFELVNRCKFSSTDKCSSQESPPFVAMIYGNSASYIGLSNKTSTVLFMIIRLQVKFYVQVGGERN